MNKLDFKALKLKDLMFITNNHGVRVMVLVQSLTDYTAAGVLIENGELQRKKGLHSITVNNFIRNFGRITVEEFKDLYPEYII